MIAPPLLEVRALSRAYGAVQAVDDLSFRLTAGQVVGFIGPNGAGKTTTMRILATLDLPDAGDAFVNGRSVLVEPREVCARLGFMSDHFEPYPNLNVAEFLDFCARAERLRGALRRERVASVLDFCGLVPVSDRPATGLSKGMGQRLHLAKTLLNDPSLLVLDEPAAGLDPRARVELRDLVRELAAAGKGVLISSHLLAELAEICDSVIVIERGRLVVDGRIGDLADKLQAHRVVRLRAHGDGEDAERFLLVQPLVQRVVCSEGVVTFDYEGDDEALGDLLGRLVGAGVRVYEFHRLEADLEEIFLRTTEGQLQ